MEAEAAALEVTRIRFSLTPGTPSLVQVDLMTETENRVGARWKVFDTNGDLLGTLWRKDFYGDSRTRMVRWRAQRGDKGHPFSTRGGALRYLYTGNLP